MNKTRVIAGGLVALFVFSGVGVEKPQEAFCAESDSVRWTIGTDARTLGFVDKRSGINYAALQKSLPVASLKSVGRTLPSNRATAENGHLRLGFVDSDATVDLNLTGTGDGLSVEVLSVRGENVEACTFVQVPLTLKGTEGEPFAACALALNLQTQVRRLPQATDFLEASCYRRFGFTGAKVALIGCPSAKLRGALQEAVNAAPELPHSPIGGPSALDADINRGSYLFAPVSEKTVDDWIRLAQNLGFTQIDFDGMSRYGDAEPYPALYPNGRAGLKAAVAKVHAAGLKAGLHSYSFFIDKRCPWVTPVPDKRLGSDAVFTLAQTLDEKNETVVVSEPVTNLSAVTGFFVRNSATLRVDDELIVYAATAKARY